ncbi:MAG: ROK family protein [Turicibacter sp.]|nr:ROK family protein [Turicibacter sp.]
MYGAIEAGGTKFVCAVADENLKITERISLPTTTPEETLAQVFEFFDRFDLEAIGIGSFGPIDTTIGSPTYGHILSTPKLAWANYDFLGAVKSRYNIPVGWTTDVNGSALGEYGLGAGKGLDSILYLTVGTGIGGGAIIDGKLREGLEMGHILLKKHALDDFSGTCPYHGGCLEGLAAGPAIGERYGIKGAELGPEHEAWDMEAYYLGQALMNYVLTLNPQRIILGGGVMKQSQLFPKVRHELELLMQGYINLPDLNTFVVPPALGDDAGITGALLLAKNSK